MSNFNGLIIFLISFICSAAVQHESLAMERGSSSAESAGSLKNQFEQFIVKYGRNYASLAEKMKRFEIFKDSLKRIKKLTANRKGNVVFGITKFADWTDEEFLSTGSSLPETLIGDATTPKQRRSPVDTSSGGNRGGSTSPRGGNSPPPKKRQKIAIPPGTPHLPAAPGTSTVNPSIPAPLDKNSDEDDGPKQTVWPPSITPKEKHVYFGDPQKYPKAADMELGELSCAACWAFAAATSVEILNGHETGQLVMLSKQQVIECDEESQGCHGRGYLDTALQFIQDAGIASEEAYPYIAQDGTCNKSAVPVVKLKAFTRLKGPEDIPEALLKSPVPLQLNIVAEFKLYRSGVYDPENCSERRRDLNHSAVIVGYTEDAWIIQNNYGPDYGENGYVFLKKGKCGIGKWAFWLELATGDTKSLRPTSGIGSSSKGPPK